MTALFSTRVQCAERAAQAQALDDDHLRGLGRGANRDTNAWAELHRGKCPGRGGLLGSSGLLKLKTTSKAKARAATPSRDAQECVAAKLIVKSGSPKNHCLNIH